MSLPWIRVYNDLPDHPKSDHLAAILQEPRAWTHVVELWLWVSRVRPDGSLAGLHPVVIAKRAGWNGDPITFVDAMRQAGFLDGDQIHDWLDYQGAHAKKLEKDRTRIRQLRDKNKNVAATLPATVDATVGAMLPASVAGNVPPLEERRGEEKREEIKSLALFASAPSEGTQEKAPRGRPPKDTPEIVSDRERWLAKARALVGLTPEESPEGKALCIRFAQVRKKRGMEQLMRALEGLEGDQWAKQQGLQTLLSDTLVEKGLAKWNKGAGTLHVSRYVHPVGRGESFDALLAGDDL
jgi:hypothetical protein